MIGIPIGLITANAAEWVFHKYVQHGWGKDRSSWWGFHFNEHHKIVRQSGYRDPGYERDPFVPFNWRRPLDLNAQGKEIVALAGSALAVTPLLPVAPFFVGTLYYCAWNYYRVHKRSHLDPDWGREHIPWHYDHHMGPNPNANWCVTRPWFDHVMRTRVPYAGTQLEAERLAAMNLQQAA